MNVAVISDAAAKAADDLLVFDRYVQPLAEILANPETEMPLTIGVFGPWVVASRRSSGCSAGRAAGCGAPREVVVAHFNPWIHRSEEDLLIPLLHALRDRLEEKKEARFLEAATAIGNAVAKLAPRHPASTSNRERALDRQDRGDARGVCKATRRVRERDQELEGDAPRAGRNKIWNEGNGARLLLFIDDLDRCQPTEIIDVLEMTKLFFDLRHTFIVIAVDKDVIDRGLEVKYNQFPFAEGRQAAIGAEYLEKMVQLPLNLFLLAQSQVRAFVEKLKAGAAVEEQLKLLEELLLPNPRKIKRIVNILAVTSAIVDSLPELANLDRGSNSPRRAPGAEPRALR